MVRERQGKCPFHLVQGMSGKLAKLRGEEHFCNASQEKNVIFIIMKVFNFLI